MHGGDLMKTTILNDILPQSKEIVIQAQVLNNCSETSDVDFYESINLITFEKSLSRLRDNYSLQLKVQSLDMFDHHQ